MSTVFHNSAHYMLAQAVWEVKQVKLINLKKYKILILREDLIRIFRSFQKFQDENRL